MQTRLRLFLDWGISFGDPYLLPERAARTVAYASKQGLEQAIQERTPQQEAESSPPPVPVGQQFSYAARSKSAHTRGGRAVQAQEERANMRTKGE